MSEYLNLNQNLNSNKINIDIQDLMNILNQIISDKTTLNLQNSYKILCQYEANNDFYLNLLKIIYRIYAEILNNNNNNNNLKNLLKFTCSSFNIFSRKNLNDENFIKQVEKNVKIKFNIL
jgi:hypothetical protein